ncbi:MAG: hypothetical protein JSV85_01130 [Candidatus Bathyarchaeota archaeon]|nr:MAG: hypothetical protein JSV85_01130 [Candidatus Bathyarchaeota archaeon]
MGLLSNHESIVWKEFHKGKPTSGIADESGREWSPSYVSRVLSRTRKKIAKALEEHARSHRLDIESLLDYKGLLIGFDYQANAQVYILFTEKLGIIVWYKHDSYAGKLCPECPKEFECREILDTIVKEYTITLRPDEKELLMTEQSIAILNKLAAKAIPRYKRKTEGD